MRYMVLLVLALIIPSDCVQESDQSVILRDFDLLLLTDRNVVILKNGTENQELRLPSFPSNTNDTANAEKHPTTYTYVAADAESNLLYFTPGNAHIAVLNVTSGLTSLVYSTDDSSSISDLSFSDNALYWIEDQVVIKSSSNNHDIAHINESSNGRIQGLAISPSSKTIYYTLWSKTARTGEIRFLNNSSNGTVLPNLPLPKSLFTDGNRLIWANNPPGIHFTIESSNFESIDHPTILMRQAHHHASSLTVHCGVIYWTDVDGKRLWEVERTVKKSRSPQSTEVSIPGYSFTSVQTLGNRCHEQPAADSPVVKVTSSSESSSTEVAPPHPELKVSPVLNTPVTAPPVKLTSAPVRFCSSEETRQITCTSGFCLVINSAPTCLYDTTSVAKLPVNPRAELHVEHVSSGDSLDPRHGSNDHESPCT
ncbi:Protein cueball [Orchesella cincta]|uniref:Protein cueball n=1 Tax=Orchesella cincta TaxID=48709 RepID=A0A1D2NCQ1_ORCCI|nr:Protein cueball [Orchesella cincta]